MNAYVAFPKPKPLTITLSNITEDSQRFIREHAGIPEALKIEVATSDRTGLVGWRLTSNGQSLLVWANQEKMAGFRLGDKFVPDIREVIIYTELPTMLTSGERIARGNPGHLRQ